MNTNKMTRLICREKCSSLLLLLHVWFCLVLVSTVLPVRANEDDEKSKVYIVYMGARQQDNVELITSTHHNMLASVLEGGQETTDLMIYSYQHGFSGFAAKLTKSQADTIAEFPDVVEVIPSHFYRLQTTRSWAYLGLSPDSRTNLLHDAKMGEDVIIGVFDSGIWPESESFNDRGLGPIPSRWKGFCEPGEDFDPVKSCNRKLIGARYFIDGFLAERGGSYNATENNDYLSVRDGLGHGTHCSSTAAGSFVYNVSVDGLAYGAVRGGAPRARLAMYKIGWEGGAIAAADVLKAFDEAIHDGVDVLSLSLGYDMPLYPETDKRDVIYYGSFHAVAHGIAVICAAGNTGPVAGTVSAVAPWVMSVAASTIDRSFPTPIILGNNQTFMGQAMYTGEDSGFNSLIFFQETGGIFKQSYCDDLLPNDTSVAGKVVLCFTLAGLLTAGNNVNQAKLAVSEAGGLGLIVAKTPEKLLDDYHDTFPCIQVSYDVGIQILNYIRSSRDPKVRIKPSQTNIGKSVSTYVTYFSCRGPNSLSPAILKPEIAAPGVNIMAAYTGGAYAFDSGTSMSTPHVTGIVCLLKSLHPDWSPAAMKSALVTTAWTIDPYSGEPIISEGDSTKIADPFDFGGGVVNPNGAKDPGLVYDMGTSDYIHYLCAMGYNDTAISQLAGYAISCHNLKNPSILDLNLPSITVPNLKSSVTVTRTVTNVGHSHSQYKAIVEAPLGINVVVKPSYLVFNPNMKKISFAVTLTTTHHISTVYYFGSLTWVDGVHKVGIPISVKTEK